jgi:hypothetical protein
MLLSTIPKVTIARGCELIRAFKQSQGCFVQTVTDRLLTPGCQQPPATIAAHWGEVWTPAAWCASRESFRSLRVDRLKQVDVLPERFRHEAGKTLPDLLRAVKAVF